MPAWIVFNLFVRGSFGGLMKMEQCPKCGSSNIEDGHVTASQRVFYYPNSAKMFTKGAPVSARTCNDCGYMELYKKLK